MPRPRKPTDVLKLGNSFKINPQRLEARQHEPKNLPPLGECPERFNDDERKAWDDILFCCPRGVATRADQIALELLAELFARSRNTQFVKNDTTGELYALPGVTAAERGQIINLLSRFGMTPADRSRVQAQSQETQDEWSEFAS